LRILLVDDEPSLLQLLGQYLTRNGHESIPTGSLQEALQLLESSDLGIFDVAVIDLALPDGSGEDIAAAILNKFGSSVRVIIATGYAYEPPGSLRGKIAVLQKPFLPRALLNVLVAG
jgi:two-component system, cell cycle response regulator